MVVFGLCGGSGSGKSTVAAILSDVGGAVLDADRIYHELVDAPSPCVSALVAAFGEQILRADGGLDRRALSRIVFFGDGSEERRAKLNRITHSFVKQEIRLRIAALEQGGASFAVIDAPLLYESGLDADCDAVIGVLASDRVRIARMTQRDGITEQEAQRRIAVQLSNGELCARADVCIENDADAETLRTAVLALFRQLQQAYFMK